MSLLSLAGEIRAYDGRALAAAVSLSEEERIERSLAADYALFVTLDKTVPSDGLVLFVTGSDLPTVKRAMGIGILLYPPRFELTGLLLALVPESVSRSNRPVIAVDLLGKDTPVPSSWELIEAGSTFRILRYRDTQPRS